MARPSERDRYKYGICTNRDKNGEGTPCPKCESKEVQKVRAGQDFVCEECKEPLRMVPPPEATRLAEQTRTLLKWLINHRKKLKWKLKQTVRIPKNR